MSFTPDKAKQKFFQVNNTQQSIQSTSQWCLFHYRHANEIVTLWRDAFINPDDSIDQSESNYRLAMFYLCNDIVQFAKKKEDKYAPILHEFSKIMPQILKFVANDTMSTHLKPKYMRVLDVWRDRFIYTPEVINKLQADLNSSDSGNIQKQNKIISKPITHTPVVSNYQQGNNTGPNIPPELTTCVDKYNKLNDLYKSYKKNLTNFNKLANSILTDVSGLTGEKETQLNNLLSSLSSLGNVGSVKGQNLSNTSSVNADGSPDLSKYNQTEALGSQLSDQFKQVSELRGDIVRELRKIAQELDDWMMLDKSKQSQIEGTLNKLKDKKNSIIQENEKVSVFNYDNDNDDDDIIPKYDNDADSDSDEDKAKNSDDSDDSDDNEDNNNKVDGQHLVNNLNDESSNVESEIENKKSSSLRKRLLNEDQDVSSESKRIKKNVKFSDENETLVFNNDEQIHDESETTNATEDTLSGASDGPSETTENGDSDLTALLGLLQ